MLPNVSAKDIELDDVSTHIKDITNVPTLIEPEAEASHKLHEAQNSFVAAWGQMGSNWGIPRTMAEVHALLYIVGEPFCTDDIMVRLQISRGSASTSIRALLDWGVVKRVHKRGDRKEYFIAEQDVWTMFRTIMRERKRREIDPVLLALHTCRDLTQELQDEQPKRKRKHKHKTTELQGDIADHHDRLDEMIRFMEMVDSLANTFISPAGKGLRAAVGLLGKVV